MRNLRFTKAANLAKIHKIFGGISHDPIDTEDEESKPPKHNSTGGSKPPKNNPKEH